MTTYAINATTISYNDDAFTETLTSSTLHVTFPDGGTFSYDYINGTPADSLIDPAFGLEDALVSGSIVPMSLFLDVSASETLNSDHLLDLSNAELAIVDFVWSGNRTTVLVVSEYNYDGSFPDSDTFFVLGGAALPAFSSPFMLQNFILNTVTFRTPLASNPVGPGNELAIAGFGNVVTEDDAIIDTTRYVSNNEIFAGVGNDIIAGLHDSDIIDGGAGFDILRYDLDESYGGWRGIIADLDVGRISDGFGRRDTVSNIEWIVGTNSADLFTAGSWDVTFEGGNASDKFIAGSGNARFEAGSGNDTMSFELDTAGVIIDASRGVAKGAGTGRDTFADVEVIVAGEGDDFIVARNNETANFTGLGGNDVIKFKNSTTGVQYGGDGDDKLVGGELADELYGDADDDAVIGNGGDDMVYGGDGSDYVYGGRGEDTVEGGAGDDFVRGNRGRDFLYGGDGNDDIEGGADDDNLNGGYGIDVLEGGTGDDWLVGGHGNDYYYGGDGADAFYFYAHGEVEFDRIQDYEDGADKIALVGFGFSSIADFSITAPSADRVVLDLSDGRKINIAGIEVADLTDSDFLF